MIRDGLGRLVITDELLSKMARQLGQESRNLPAVRWFHVHAAVRDAARRMGASAPESSALADRVLERMAVSARMEPAGLAAWLASEPVALVLRAVTRFAIGGALVERQPVEVAARPVTAAELREFAVVHVAAPLAGVAA